MTPKQIAQAYSRASLLSSRVAEANCGKVPRHRVARLVVVADICPQVFLRVLGLLAQRDIVPLSIRFDHRPRSLRFEIDVNLRGAADAEIIAAKVGTIVRVRSARWASCRGI